MNVKTKLNTVLKGRAKIQSFNTIDLSLKISNEPELLFDYLGIEYRLSYNKITMPCPIHGGDNRGAVVINLNAEPIIWKCYTNHCEDKGKNIFNFISSLQNISYWSAVRLVDKLYSGVKLDPLQRNIREEISHVKIPKLFRPSNYFLRRGFLPQTLLRFNVGFCYDRNSKLFGRHVTPIYDINNKCVGLSGRTMHEKCKCGSYHVGKCPDYYIPKWKCNKGFNSTKVFYNIHSHKFIKDEVIITEGQPNVWRFYEAGVYNVLGLLGGYIDKSRINILKKIGVKKVIVVMDGDKAGKEHEEHIRKNLVDFELKCIRPKTDVGDLTIKETKELCRRF